MTPSVMTTTTPVECDCLNWCGDDPWLKDGRAQPCKALKKQKIQAAIHAKRDKARMVLHRRYNTATIEDLVDAQASHIAKLELERGEVTKT